MIDIDSLVLYEYPDTPYGNVCVCVVIFGTCRAGVEDAGRFRTSAVLAVT